MIKAIINNWECGARAACSAAKRSTILVLGTNSLMTLRDMESRRLQLHVAGQPRHAAFKLVYSVLHMFDDKRFRKALKNKYKRKIKRRFDDSMSSLSRSNYIIELIVYIVVAVSKNVDNLKGY